MFFGSKNQLVGLDIGSRAIKVAEAQETKKGWVLKKFGLIDIDPGLIEEGVIKDPQAVADNIRALFKQTNIRKNHVAISIGGYSVIVKNIAIQNMPEEQLHESINFEAEQYIPFDINDVNLDFQILGVDEQNPNQMNVMLVAAKKDMINDYINLIDLAGLSLGIIDIDAFALQNVFDLNYDGSEGNITLIDIGASKTSVNILKNKASVFMRDVSLGCNQVNARIMETINCSPAEAEEIKLGNKSSKIEPEVLNNICRSVFSDWTDEIRRAMDFFYSTNPDDEIKRIFLSGGGANIAEFRELLASQSGTEVMPINPFQKFTVDDSMDKDYLKQMGPQTAIAMGLSIRKVDDK
jgi:type IV pilus assembly protein PilM